MFNWLNKKIANPSGLDSSLFWLNSLSSEKEREDSANKICLLCYAALLRNRDENIDLNYFVKLFKNSSDEALHRYHKKEIPLTDPSCKYIAFAFVLLLKNFNDHPDAKINMAKILEFLDENAQPEAYAKITNILQNPENS